MILSFIIPVYNTEFYLEKCVSSITSQIGNLCEIIIVNDGSTDDSLVVIERLALQNTCIRIIDQSNAGLGAARNAALRIAQGKYIFFLDSDDFLLPNSLNKLLEELKTSDCDILGLDGEMIYPNNQYKPMKRKSSLYNREIVGAEYMANNNLSAGSWYIYSYAFIKTYNLWMPEGIVHEDELFDSKGFILAKKYFFYTYQSMVIYDAKVR